MIDTINFKLHNVSSYQTIKSQFEHTSKNGSTQVLVDEDTGLIQESSRIRVMLHHDSDNITPLSKRSSLFVPSSHYNISYLYNIAQDFLDFNLSVPKYIYGTNVLQHIKYFDQSPDAIFDLVQTFFNAFILKTFFEKVSPADIEITRLDLCYNQFFATKFDALEYLRNQKELLKKYARTSKNDWRSYDTSLQYVTHRYSFKIYHKGTEFRKNDLKELTKRNPTGEPLQKLIDESDRILRYEITFRKSMFDYLYVQRNLADRVVDAAFKGHSHSYIRLVDNVLYSEAVHFTEHSKYYILGKIDAAESIHSKTVQFDQYLFNEMYNFFWDTVKKYQLNIKMSVYEVGQKIDQMNEIADNVPSENTELRRKSRYNKAQFVTLALLTQFYSLDDLKKSGLIPKTTMYRIIKKLKELGYASEDRLETMPVPELDYLDYKSIFGHHHLK